MKVFFCKYNDPIYVKMEKLEIMIMLASERNIDQVLLEFKEYSLSFCFLCNSHTLGMQLRWTLNLYASPCGQ